VLKLSVTAACGVMCVVKDTKPGGMVSPKLQGPD
jgi:hypothetical protein